MFPDSENKSLEAQNTRILGDGSSIIKNMIDTFS